MLSFIKGPGLPTEILLATTRHTDCAAMNSSPLQSCLLSLPHEVQRLIMLEVYNSQDLVIGHAKTVRAPFKPKALFDTAPLRVCKQLRFDALTILTCGIGLRIPCLCDMPEQIDLIPTALQGCIRYLDTNYNNACCKYEKPDGNGWLGREALEILPNLEVIMHGLEIAERSCSVPSAWTTEDLQKTVVSDDMVEIVNDYFEQWVDIDVKDREKSGPLLTAHFKVMLAPNWQVLELMGNLYFVRVSTLAVRYQVVKRLFFADNRNLRRQGGHLGFQRGS